MTAPGGPHRSHTGRSVEGGSCTSRVRPVPTQSVGAFSLDWIGWARWLYLGRMNSSPVDPRDLRVSDDERSHVLALLEKATGRGLIDLGEYTERSGLVIAARTRRDLNAVLLDLPGLEIAGRTVDAAQHAAQPPTRPIARLFRRACATGAQQLRQWGCARN